MVVTTQTVENLTQELARVKNFSHSVENSLDAEKRKNKALEKEMEVGRSELAKTERYCQERVAEVGRCVEERQLGLEERERTMKEKLDGFRWELREREAGLNRVGEIGRFSLGAAGKGGGIESIGRFSLGAAGKGGGVESGRRNWTVFVGSCGKGRRG